MKTGSAVNVAPNGSFLYMYTSEVGPAYPKKKLLSFWISQ